MSWTSIGNVALFAVMILLAGAATYTLTGLDRWLNDRRERREHEMFDVFSDGRWYE